MQPQAGVAATATGAGAASQQLGAAGAEQLARRVLHLASKPESNFGRAGLAHGSASQQLGAGAAQGAGSAQGAGAGAAQGAGAGAASQQLGAGAAAPLQAFLRACNLASKPSRLALGAHGSQAGAGAGSQAATAGALQEALRACKRVKSPSRFGAGAQAGAASQAGAGAGAGAQQEAASAPLQSFLRLKIPAEALEEEAIAHPTMAKAMINRRIRKSPISKKGYTTSRVLHSMAANSLMSVGRSNAL